MADIDERNKLLLDLARAKAENIDLRESKTRAEQTTSVVTALVRAGCRLDALDDALASFTSTARHNVSGEWTINGKSEALDKAVQSFLNAKAYLRGAQNEQELSKDVPRYADGRPVPMSQMTLEELDALAGPWPSRSAEPEPKPAPPKSLAGLGLDELDALAGPFPK